MLNLPERGTTPAAMAATVGANSGAGDERSLFAAAREV
jgi:hypothetical protein